MKSAGCPSPTPRARFACPRNIHRARSRLRGGFVNLEDERGSVGELLVRLNASYADGLMYTRWKAPGPLPSMLSAYDSPIEAPTSRPTVVAFRPVPVRLREIAAHRRPRCNRQRSTAASPGRRMHQRCTHHSLLSASIGSTRVARRAGPRQATAPASRNASATATSVDGSLGSVSNK